MTRMKRFVGTALVVALAAAGTAAQAQNGPPPGARPGGPPGGAQQQGATVRGTVVDAASGRPVPSASVGVWSAADSALVTGAVARPDGSYRIEGLRPGRYYLRASALGYNAGTTPLAVAPGTPQVDAGPLRLQAGAVAIEGLTATAERSTISLAPDRNTYAAKDLPSSAGGSAVDVLRNVPAIEVDADGKVSLRGNQNVAVQINGRAAPMTGDQLAQFLQTLPANVVDRVEVVPNPSAKYDPEGMAGIVNLVLKQNTDLGTSGGITAGVGTGGKASGSGNVGYQKGDLTLFASYGLFVDQRGSRGFNNRQWLQPPANVSPFLRQTSSGELDALSHTFTASADLKLGKENTLSSSLLLGARGFDNSTSNIYRELNAGETLVGRYDRLTEGDNGSVNLDASLAFKRVLQAQRHELSAELRFTRNDDEFRNDFTQRRLTLAELPADDQPGLETNDLDALGRNVALQADYTRPLGERAKLETGYKGTLRMLDNGFAADSFAYATGAWERDLARSNDFEFSETVHAAYGVLSGSVGSVNLQGGLRVERAATTFDLTTTGESFDNDYTSLFPSALVAWNLSPSRQVKASYSRRVRRPDTRLLNPFAVYEDPQNLFVGNPSLSPEYTHAMELGLQQSGRLGSLQLTSFFRRTEGAIRRIRTVDDAGISTTTFRNFATSDSYGADATGSLRLGDKLSGFASLNASKTVSDGSNVGSGLDVNAFGWSARANATYKLTPRTDVQAFYLYRAPQDVEQGRVSAFTILQFSLRQKLIGDRGTVSLRVVDPFNTMGFTIVTTDERYTVVSEQRWGARAAYLTFQYNIGKAPRLRQDPQQPDPTQQQPSGIPGS
jgi:ferric enterobactin receptor